VAQVVSVSLPTCISVAPVWVRVTVTDAAEVRVDDAVPSASAPAREMEPTGGERSSVSCTLAMASLPATSRTRAKTRRGPSPAGSVKDAWLPAGIATGVVVPAPVKVGSSESVSAWVGESGLASVAASCSVTSRLLLSAGVTRLAAAVGGVVSRVMVRSVSVVALPAASTSIARTVRRPSVESSSHPMRERMGCSTALGRSAALSLTMRTCTKPPLGSVAAVKLRSTSWVCV
jgi:hypothetical protein